MPVEQSVSVANLVGQHGLRSSLNPRPVDYTAIRSGLKHVRAEALQSAASVHMPKIGAGLAGGDWPVIERIVVDELADHGVPVFVYSLPGSK